ncbi:unnamed protein product [Rotaria sp. Silwood2]|nr:unnamed protein product [Rotaria sp. Silwood2]CAF3029236.1 unnamed protein product [Rotaria sp. Silwood2]CAF3388120.1 unnamed protein product [Rotaria sp. Silwood2]CAF4191843.1 unnamed protein product [Rotaria sp. Silwood2]CAF4251511.1 unnamed protein product [Rotaria sp. Silwood2]
MHVFRIAFNVPIMEGSSQIDSLAAGTSTHPVDMSFDKIGSPVSSVDIKLIDILGTIYRSEMNQGEIWIRRSSVFKDRTQHIFKLNHGKYIAPEHLEDLYIRSRWVAQIFIDSILTEATVVAIPIPDEEYVQKNFQLIRNETAFADLCKNAELKEIILSDLKQLAEKKT